MAERRLFGGQRTERLPRRCGIRRDLRLQRVETVELPLRTDEVDHPDAEMSAVEIFGEVEEMDLERQLQSVDRRPAAQVRDGVAPPWRLPVVDCRPHRIHAECRNQLLAHVDVSSEEHTSELQSLMPNS